MTNIVLTPVLLKIAAEPQGLKTCAVPGYTTEEIGRQVQKLCAAGKLHRATISRKVVRYFTCPKRAKEWLAMNGPYSAAVRKKTPGRNASAFAPDVQAIETERTKRTEMQTPDCLKHHRFYVDPASLQPGPFSSLPPGKYAFEPASCAARAS